MDAGWCWRISVMEEDHRGYVFSSAFLDDAAAEAEMRRKNPELGRTRLIRFMSGRHREFWLGNVAAMGNSYGFVEPLESTALHMVIVQLAYLLDGFDRMARGDSQEVRRYARFANEAVGSHWDFLRWFLAIHYRFNRRLDTPFWQAARASVDIGGLSPLVERFRALGPWLSSDGGEFPTGDPTFGFHGTMMMLLGQHVPGPVRPPEGLSRAAWEQRQAGWRGLQGQALSHRDTLEALLADPRHLREFVGDPASWCRRDAERVPLIPFQQPGAAPHRS
jgi:tryptophan halogenase